MLSGCFCDHTFGKINDIILFHASLDYLLSNLKGCQSLSPSLSLSLFRFLSVSFSRDPRSKEVMGHLQGTTRACWEKLGGRL